MWQETSLPKGKYRVNLGGISLGRDKGSVKAVFVVCRGTKGYSDIVIFFHNVPIFY